MGSGVYVGRVGGLAVALGVGAAILAGAATAAADDDTASKTTSGATSASSSSTSESGTASETSAKDKSEKDDPKSESRRRVGRADEEKNDTADEGSTGEGSTDEAVTDEGVETEDDSDAADEDTREVTPEPEQAADEAEEPEPEPERVAEPVAEHEPAAESTDEPEPDQPEVPAGPSLMMPLVSAGREATEDAEQPADDAVTMSLVDDGYPIPTEVQVTEVTAPLQWLQDVPIVGPLVVTPVVRLLHLVPLVGEFLHPVIGWPVDHDAPPGSPRPRTVRVTSFDGTEIYAHFMPARGLGDQQQAPTVFSGPGLGLPGATTLDLPFDGLLPYDVIGVGALRNAGYNVVTWDPRGEWRSGGVMHLNSPDLEGRDVSAIITWVASLPEAELNGDNDPKIGMVGASYGGGIQLSTAAIDHRIDAIVPTIAWNNLVDVLFPRNAVNSSWGTILPAVLELTLAREHPRILPVAVMGVLFGIAQQSDIDLVNSFGYHDQIDDITAPTLLIQGTVDTLFTLDQADVIARQLIKAGTTTKVVWYCGGHGACLSSFNDGGLVIDRTLDWLDRYVKGNEKTDTGPQFEWVDQNGDWHGSETYPAPGDATPIVATSTRRETLPYIPLLGGSGPNPWILTRGPIATLLGLPSASWAANAADLHVPDAVELTHVVGAPQLTLTYSGTGTAKHVYAQIVDDETGLVLGNHATPIPVELDGKTHTVTYSLEQVAHTLAPGQSVTVQIVTSAVKFLNFYSWGAITVEGMSITLPTPADVTTVQVAAA